MRTFFGEQLKIYHEAQAAAERLKLKKATSDLKAPGRSTAAAYKSALAEKTCSNSSLRDVMGPLLSDGDGTDDEYMSGSKDDQNGDDTGYVFEKGATLQLQSLQSSLSGHQHPLGCAALKTNALVKH